MSHATITAHRKYECTKTIDFHYDKSAKMTTESDVEQARKQTIRIQIQTSFTDLFQGSQSF